MTYFASPEQRTIQLPVMTPDDAERLLGLLDAITSALYARWEEWHEEQLELPFDAALEIAVPPHPDEEARDRADADKLEPELGPPATDPSARQPAPPSA